MTERLKLNREKGAKYPGTNQADSKTVLAKWQNESLLEYLFFTAFSFSKK
jgi:hypothetical protein